jgi:Zn-dependent protease with chaperone function
VATRSRTAERSRLGSNVKWADFAAQSIFHTLVAALVTEALVRLWRVEAARQRMALRLVALAHPLVVLPAVFILFPDRSGEEFREATALFAGRRWEDVELLGVPLFHLWLGLFAAMGLALYLLDLVPLLRGRRATPRPGPRCPGAVRIEGEIAALAPALGVTPPPVAFLEVPGPVLFVAGVKRPVVVVSRGAAERLDPSELRAALAHELAHLARGDPEASWRIMAARAMMFFNPAFQVVARALVRDAERRADELASGAAGDPLALASGLVKLYRASEAQPPAPGRRNLPFAAALSGPLARARSADVVSRCRRLMASSEAPEVAFGTARTLAAAATLAVLLFFVV